jgi:hypothetical protein
MMEMFEHIIGPVHVGPVDKHNDKTVQDLCVNRWRATLLRPPAIRYLKKSFNANRTLRYLHNI